jgi:hypothetical protein
MVGHGITGQFIYNFSETKKNKILKASDLDDWLDQFQEQTGNPVITIYDACYSGSFLQTLKASSGQKRINISSTRAEQLAYFAASGHSSFSFQFWALTQKGRDLNTTFSDTVELIRSISSNGQKPQMDDNADGIYTSKEEGNYARTLSIGQKGETAAALPIITEFKHTPQIEDQSTLEVEIKLNFPNDLIQRAWITIVSPTLQKNNTALVEELVEVTLTYDSTSKSYKGTLTGFNQNGTYQLVALASLSIREGKSFISLPRINSVFSKQNNISKASLETIANETHVILPNASFAGQFYQADLKIIASPNPNEIWFELANATIAQNTEIVTAVVEQVSLDLSIPSIAVGDKNFRAFLEFLDIPDVLRWKLDLSSESGSFAENK